MEISKRMNKRSLFKGWKILLMDNGKWIMQNGETYMD